MSNKYKNINPFGDGLVNIGHGNYVQWERIIGILDPNSLSMKKLREKAEEEKRLVNAAKGRKTRSLIITDSNHVILSALSPQTLAERGRAPAPIEPTWEEGDFLS